MPTCFQTLDSKIIYKRKAQPKADKNPTSYFSLLNCCLSVVLWLDKGADSENLHVVFCHDKHSFFSFSFFVDNIEYFAAVYETEHMNNLLLWYPLLFPET